MSGKSYEAEYQTSIKANRIVKDLVKQKLPKGITFDPGCWEAFNSLSPKQQLSAANQLCRSNLGAAVNPSAYFRKILTRVKGTEGKISQTGRDVLGSIVHSRQMIECLDEECLSFFGELTEAQQRQAVSEMKRRITPSIRNPSAFFTMIMGEVENGSKDTSSLALSRSAAKSPPVPAASEGRLTMQRLISDAVFLDDLLPECRRAYKKLPSEAQHRVKQMCAEILAVRTKSEAFMLALHNITGQDSPQPSPTEGTTSMGNDVLLPAKWADSVNKDLYEDDTPHTQHQAWPKDPLELQPNRSSPSESQTPSQWEEQSTSATAHNEPHHPHAHLQAWAPPPPPAPERSRTSEPQEPSQDEGQGTLVAADGSNYEEHPHHTELQAWRPPSPPLPERRLSSESAWWRRSQAPSRGGGQVSVAAAAPEAAAAPPMQQEDPRDGKGAARSRSTPSSWAGREAAEAKLASGRTAQRGRDVLAKTIDNSLLRNRLNEECLECFEELTEAQQLGVARLFKCRLNPNTKDPCGILTRLIATAQGASRRSGLQRPTPSAERPAMPATRNRNRVLNGQRLSDSFLLYNLPPECRRAYERLPLEAQYRVKQLCAKFEAVRTHPEAFMNAIYDITGQGRLQQQPDKGMDSAGKDELTQANWSASADEGQHEDDSPHSCLQAWPEDAQEIQPKRSSPSESETPSHWEERSTSATADDESDHPHAELQASPKHTLKIQPKRSNSSELQMPSHWEERSTVATADDESDHTEQQALPKDAQEVQPKSSSPAESQTPNHWEEQSTSATAAADDEPSHTEVQAWPEEHDALDIQPTRSCSVESQTPSQWEERGTSAAADDEPSHPHTELQAWTKDAPKSSSPSESQTPSRWEEQSTSATATTIEKLDHPHTELQARPSDDPETQPVRDTPPEGQAPTQEEGQDTSAAKPEDAAMPVTVEAIDTAAQELMGLLNM